MLFQFTVKLNIYLINNIHYPYSNFFFYLRNSILPQIVLVMIHMQSQSPSFDPALILVHEVVEGLVYEVVQAIVVLILV